MKNIVILDTIPFNGGSKKATLNLLETLDDSIHPVVYSTNPIDWTSNSCSVYKIYEFKGLIHQQEGLLYLLRHFCVFLNLLFRGVFFQKELTLVGTSLPSNDLAMYFLSSLLKYQKIQFIHGDLPLSKLSTKTMLNADHVFYLESATSSIEKNLSNLLQRKICLLQEPKFTAFINGLSEKNWPSQCNRQKGLKLFWAASLLKWKGLDLLLQALENFPEQEAFETHICYLKPQNIDIEMSSLPEKTSNLSTYEAPKNLDQIRSKCNVFISTSQNEPFGLSVLEAMAAGHVIIIPKDGAYWDKTLTHNKNCLKYEAKSATSLANTLENLKSNKKLLENLNKASLKFAKQYKASKTYQCVREVL